MPKTAAAAGPVAEVPIDPVALTRGLIRCASVTPADAGAIDVLIGALTPLGFVCHDLSFGAAEGRAPIRNLYARWGSTGPVLGFAGHTDVVPPGDPALWRIDPFAAVVEDGWLYGRGACDMKSGVAAFATAAAQRIAATPDGAPGSIALLITGDEEADAVDGTRRLLDWMAERGERLDACVVGEPTSRRDLGDTIKIGRRGSLNARLTVEGVQGHTAYPHLADNPAHRLIAMLSALLAEPLDDGSDAFEPSSLSVTSIDIGNPADNVIPARATARFNIRFNDRHTGRSLEGWLRDRLGRVGGTWHLDVSVSGEAFALPPGGFADLASDAVAAATGRRPERSTGGGTSDARFVKDHCPVVECGLVGATLHQVDERVSLAEIHGLTAIYRTLLDRFFAAGSGLGEGR